MKKNILKFLIFVDLFINILSTGSILIYILGAVYSKESFFRIDLVVLLSIFQTISQIFWLFVLFRVKLEDRSIFKLKVTYLILSLIVLPIISLLGILLFYDLAWTIFYILPLQFWTVVYCYIQLLLFKEITGKKFKIPIVNSWYLPLIFLICIAAGLGLSHYLIGPDWAHYK